MLEVTRLSKSFGGLLALADLSFSIAEGEVVGLNGPNGSGKSTVFNVITGMFPPTSGQIIFRDEDITHMPAREVTSRGVGSDLHPAASAIAEKNKVPYLGGGFVL